MKRELITLISINIFLLFSAKAQIGLPEDYNLKGKVKSLDSYLYEATDKFGKIEKGNNSIYGSYKKTYDIRGNKIEEIRCVFYSNKESIREKIISEYDSNGSIKEDNVFNSDNSLKFRRIYTCDNKGVKVSEKLYYSDGSLSETVNFKYNDNAKLTEERIINSDGILHFINIYEYDNKCIIVTFLLSNVDNFKKDLNHKTRYKYNKQGDCIEEIGYHSDGSIRILYKYKYQYDKNDNWLSKVQYYRDKPTEIRERNIVYF